MSIEDVELGPVGAKFMVDGLRSRLAKDEATINPQGKLEIDGVVITPDV